MQSPIDFFSSLTDPRMDRCKLHKLSDIESERYHKSNGQIEKQTRYYISSLQPDAVKLNEAIREHWGIENQLHWTLDVAFGEDKSQKRAGYAAQNFSLINKVALNLLTNEKVKNVEV